MDPEVYDAIALLADCPTTNETPGSQSWPEWDSVVLAARSLRDQIIRDNLRPSEQDYQATA